MLMQRRAAHGVEEDAEMTAGDDSALPVTEKVAEATEVRQRLALAADNAGVADRVDLAIDAAHRVRAWRIVHKIEIPCTTFDIVRGVSAAERTEHELRRAGKCRRAQPDRGRRFGLVASSQDTVR